MKEITVLVSASGAPGTAALLKGLRANGERTGAARRHRHERALDRPPPLRRVPPRPGRLAIPGFADAILDVVERERVDCVLPAVVLRPRGARRASRSLSASRCCVSSPDTIHRSNDKAETYALLQRLTVRLVGTDMSERSIGRHLCDEFHLVPAGSDPGFADAILDVVEREGVDCVLPQSSHDLEGLAAHRERFPVPVLVSSPDTIHRSNDKAETYALLQRLGIDGPDFRRVNGSREVEAAARELGYPDRPVCFKPVFSSGSRGFRILDPTVDRAHQLLNERPGSVAMRLEEAVELLPDEGGPDLLVMELATGGERTIDGIADGERVVLGHPKTREAMRAGLAMYFVTLEDEALMETADRLVAELAIEHFFNIQLVGEHVIEINPRISTIVYQDDLNLPYLGVKRALGEISDEELVALRGRVRPGRTALRYFDQVEWDA